MLKKIKIENVYLYVKNIYVYYLWLLRLNKICSLFIDKY